MPKKKRKNHSPLNRRSEASLCPSCGVRLNEGAATICPRCLFTIEKTPEIFRFPAPVLHPIMDHVEILDEPARQTINDALAPINKKYPQINVYVCFVNLIPKTNPKVFNFWLLNKSPLTEKDSATQRKYSLLLTLECQEKRLAATPGYLLEPWLPNSKLKKALMSLYKGIFVNHDFDSFHRFSQTLLEILAESENAKR